MNDLSYLSNQQGEKCQQKLLITFTVCWYEAMRTLGIYKRSTKHQLQMSNVHEQHHNELGLFTMSCLSNAVWQIGNNSGD